MTVEKRYLVRFVRRDGQPDEIYNYAHRSDAEYHFGLFQLGCLEETPATINDTVLIFGIYQRGEALLKGLRFVARVLALQDVRLCHLRETHSMKLVDSIRI